METTRKIKYLKSKAKDTKDRLDIKRDEIRKLQQEFNTLNKEYRQIKDDIIKLESDGTIKVSEHAILRFLERMKGLNTDEIESIIISDELVDQVKVLGGNGTFTTKDGKFQVKMKNYTITTII